MNRIGWNLPTAELRAWIFGSEETNGEGLLHLDGDNLVLKSTGVMTVSESRSRGHATATAKW